jgi:hypothetical protein
MARISLITSRKLGAFSQRDMVGCEHRSMAAAILWAELRRRRLDRGHPSAIAVLNVFSEPASP